MASRARRRSTNAAAALISSRAPLSTSKAIKGIAALNDRVVREYQHEVARRQRVARESRRTLAPFVRMIESDERALAASKKLRRELLGQPRPKLRFPRVLQNVESQVRAGSIMSIIGAPYDWEWGQEGGRDGTTWGSWVAYKGGSDPRFNTTTNIGNGGSAWASAGLGKHFIPAGANSTWVRVGFYAPCDYDWRVSSTLEVAHSRAFIGVYVQSHNLQGGDPRDEVDRRIWLWSEGSSWYQDHSDSGSAYYPSDTYFLASSGRQYSIWAWCHASADASSGSIAYSYAWGTLSVRLPFMVLEQWT